MEITTKKRSIYKSGPKQGPNAKLVRVNKNMTQETLADIMGMSQSKISALELQDEIDDETLDKFAAALEVPVDFLKNFEMEETMKQYTFNNSEVVNATAAENSTNAVVQGQGEQENIINNYNYPLDRMAELYERLLKEKEQQIEELKAKQGL